MEYKTIIILLLLAVFGLILYIWFKRGKGISRAGMEALRKRTEERKQKILQALRECGKITNDEVRELLGVSHASATRYMDLLENEGKVAQKGDKKGVFYELKK